MPSSASRNPELLRANRLLALLPPDTLAALAPSLQLVPLRLRDTVAEEGKPIRHVYFPVQGVISMLASVEGTQRAVEIGTVGNEGMAGLPLFLGAARSPGETFVQVPGQGWRAAARPFLEAVQAHPPLARVLLRYTQALMVQISQSTACNRAHSPLQRCARWLLMTHDRVPEDTFELTQEFLAQMLGERRPTVSRAASQLQARGMIRYSRGRVTVLDRPRLMECACACYGVVRSEYDAALR
jgi:CRP-like cAMP-binding protein